MIINVLGFFILEPHWLDKMRVDADRVIRRFQKHIKVSVFFVIKFFFLNSRYANFQMIPMNVSVRAEDFQRAR